MTPGCTKQACDFSDSLESLGAQGYEVLGISPDKPEKLAKFRERDHLGITLLSDQDKSVINAYGAFGEKKMYGKTVQGVIRSTFVVDESGNVQVAQYNVKATGHVARLKKDLGLSVLRSDVEWPPRDRSATVEATALGAVQCEFESRRAHARGSWVGAGAMAPAGNQRPTWRSAAEGSSDHRRDRPQRL